MKGLAVLAACAALVLALWLGRHAIVLPEAEEELRLMIWGAPDEVKTVRDYVRSFREKHPKIAVKIQHVPDMGYREKLNTRFRGGDPPDVFYLAYEDFPGIASRGWMLPLDDVIAKDPSFDPHAFFPEVYEKFRWEDGKLYGIVKDFATLVLYYNKDLFDKYDVPYPKRGWTWDDFLAKAKRLTHPEAREYGVVLETWPGQWLPWLWSADGELVEQRKGDARCVLGDPKYIQKNARAFQFLSDLIWKHQVEPAPSVTRDQGTSDLFLTGRAAMCTYGRWMCMQFRHIKDFDWDVVELPEDDREASTLFPVCYAISRDTRHPAASWELVKYLTGRDAQVDMANSGQAIPSMESVARSDAFAHPKALEGMNVAAEPNITSASFADPGPSLLVWQEVRETMRVGLDPLWNGTRRDARKLLEELHGPVSAIVAREKKMRAEARGK